MRRSLRFAASRLIRSGGPPSGRRVLPPSRSPDGCSERHRASHAGDFMVGSIHRLECLGLTQIPPDTSRAILGPVGLGDYLSIEQRIMSVPLTMYGH
jgi:hypothetical protein